MSGFKRSPQSTLHSIKGEFLFLFFNIGNMSCNAFTWCGGGSWKKLSTAEVRGGGSWKKLSTACSAEAATTSPRRTNLTEAAYQEHPLLVYVRLTVIL